MPTHFALMSKERQHQILERELLLKQKKRDIGSHKTPAVASEEKRIEEAPEEKLSARSCSDEEAQLAKTGEILSDLAGKQAAAFREVCAIKKCPNPATEELDSGSSDDQSTDVPDSDEDEEAEWSLIPDGGSWDDTAEDEAAVVEEELASSNKLVAIPHGAEGDGVGLDKSIFKPRGGWDPRQGGTMARLDALDHKYENGQDGAVLDIVGSVRHRKEAEVQQEVCGSALTAVKMLRRKSEGRIEQLQDNWAKMFLEKTFKYDTKEQGVSIIPEGGYDWKKMSVQQRALVHNNLRQYKLEQARQKQQAAEQAKCTFAPKTNPTRRNRAGKEIKSKVFQGIIARRPSTCA
jgi:hypothetical protein